MWQADDAVGYVLHTMPYRGSSLICDVLTKDFGRIRLLALSARGPKSRFRGIFQTFSLIKFSARGRSELRKVSQADCIHSIVDLQSIPLFCAYYMNECIRLLLPAEEPTPALFDVYAQSLEAFAHADGQAVMPYLRLFEKTLLEICGYGINFATEARTHAPIDSEQSYQFYPDEGFVLSGLGPASLSGKTILAIAQHQWTEPAIAQQAKIIFRRAMAVCLQGRALASRDLLKSFL
jgi:DNA repair protein RecO (recombination protein O)